MAQEEQALIRELVRTIDKRCHWETKPNDRGGLDLTLQFPFGKATTSLRAEDLVAAAESSQSFYRLRERIKKARKSLRDAGKPYMPWQLPKIEPLAGPSPRGGGGGGWSPGPRR